LESDFGNVEPNCPACMHPSGAAFSHRIWPLVPNKLSGVTALLTAKMAPTHREEHTHPLASSCFTFLPSFLLMQFQRTTHDSNCNVSLTTLQGKCICRLLQAAAEVSLFVGLNVVLNSACCVVLCCVLARSRGNRSTTRNASLVSTARCSSAMGTRTRWWSAPNSTGKAPPWLTLYPPQQALPTL